MRAARALVVAVAVAGCGPTLAADPLPAVPDPYAAVEASLDKSAAKDQGKVTAQGTASEKDPLDTVKASSGPVQKKDEAAAEEDPYAEAARKEGAAADPSGGSAKATTNAASAAAQAQGGAQAQVASSGPVQEKDEAAAEKDPYAEAARKEGAAADPSGGSAKATTNAASAAAQDTAAVGQSKADKATPCFKENAQYHPMDMQGHISSFATSAQACQMRCATISGCKHFTFIPADQTCHVTDGVYLVVNKPGFTAGPQKCDMDAAEHHDNNCWIKNAAYTPLDMPGAPVTFETDARECQARCVGREGCLHFTFSEFDGACHVTDGRILTTGVEGSVAGHQNCTGHCLHENAAYFPRDMAGESESKTENAEACQARCANTKGCKHFTFVDAARLCHITDGEELVVNQAGLTAGPRICQYPHTDTVLLRSSAGSLGLFGVPSPGASVAFAALAVFVVLLAVAAAAGLRSRTMATSRDIVTNIGPRYTRCNPELDQPTVSNEA